MHGFDYKQLLTSYKYWYSFVREGNSLMPIFMDHRVWRTVAMFCFPPKHFWDENITVYIFSVHRIKVFHEQREIVLEFQLRIKN